MDFEWNPKKSLENKKKHGISFDEAIAIWQRFRIEASNIAHSKDGEARSATVGLIKDDIYTVIWTKRNERIRIICARRARANEKKTFLKNI